ncbi:MAG: hypothetical protein ACR2N1_21670 [Rubripirellula sp.]
MNAKNITAQKQTTITIGMTELLEMPEIMTVNNVPKKTNNQARDLRMKPPENSACGFADLA